MTPWVSQKPTQFLWEAQAGSVARTRLPERSVPTAHAIPAPRWNAPGEMTPAVLKRPDEPADAAATDAPVTGNVVEATASVARPAAVARKACPAVNALAATRTSGAAAPWVSIGLPKSTCAAPSASTH